MCKLKLRESLKNGEWQSEGEVYVKKGKHLVRKEANIKTIYTTEEYAVRERG